MRRIGVIFAIVISLGFASSTVAQDAIPTQGTELFMVDLGSGTLTSAGTVDATVVAFALDTSASAAGPAWALTHDGQLLRFNVSSPETIESAVEVTGLDEGDSLIGIDLRPANGELIGISAAGILYSIGVNSGVAIALGSSLDPALEAETLGFDFNPTVDRIRVGVGASQNLRLNPDTGAVGRNPDTGMPTIDGNLTYAEGDIAAGSAPIVVGAAYTNSVGGAEETQLYVIDAAQNALALQNPPNDGILNSIAELPEFVNAYSSFDIAPSGEAYLTIPAWTDLVTAAD